MLEIVLLFFAFALVHSITVAHWFKSLCIRAFGETFLRVWYRFLYTVISALTAAAAIVLIREVPDRVLWVAPLWFRWCMRIVQLTGLTFGMLAFERLNAWEFLGLRQVWRYIAKREVAGTIEGLTQRDLVTTGVYGIVRHPLYLAGIVLFTFSPDVTANGLTVTVLADLYFLFGMFIEERRFMRIFGEPYREYAKRVPMMVPRIIRKKSGAQ